MSSRVYAAAALLLAAPIGAADDPAASKTFAVVAVKGRWSPPLAVARHDRAARVRLEVFNPGDEPLPIHGKVELRGDDAPSRRPPSRPASSS